MSKDPAFLFYPGDYLRDTQCLSEKVQVAYDRIMCEHMRNICISQAQLKFFTKKLSADEVEELEMVLTKVEGGYQIDWVVDSINKRRDYSQSRAKNRSSKNKEKQNNTSTSYDAHMEIENENINTVLRQIEERENISIQGELKKYYMFLIVEMVKIFIEKNPDYFFDKETDYHACLQIAYNIATMKKWSRAEVTNGKMNSAIESWKIIVAFVNDDVWFKTRSLSDISSTKEWQRIVQKMNSKPKGGAKEMAY